MAGFKTLIDLQNELKVPSQEIARFLEEKGYLLKYPEGRMGISSSGSSMGSRIIKNSTGTRMIGLPESICIEVASFYKPTDKKGIQNQDLYDYYKLLFDERIDLFQLPVKERLRNKNRLTNIKVEIDKIEKSIIKQIKNGVIRYENVESKLKLPRFKRFLKEDKGVQDYLEARKIADAADVNFDELNSTRKKYESLCREVWADHIITKEERKQLDNYAANEGIDSHTQFIIESQIIDEISDGFDLDEIIRFYLFDENRTEIEIAKIIAREYHIHVPTEKIKKKIEELNPSINLKTNSNLGLKDSIYTSIQWASDIKFYVMAVDKVTSGQEFSIAFEKNKGEGHKIYIERETIKKSEAFRIKEIITDAICYATVVISGNDSLETFMSLKRKFRNKVMSLL